MDFRSLKNDQTSQCQLEIQIATSTFSSTNSPTWCARSTSCCVTSRQLEESFRALDLRVRKNIFLEKRYNYDETIMTKSKTFCMQFKKFISKTRIRIKTLTENFKFLSRTLTLKFKNLKFNFFNF